MKYFILALFPLFCSQPVDVPSCQRTLTLTNWVTPTGVDCFIPVFMYKMQPNGQWAFVAAFQNNIPQEIQVEYGGFYAWDFSWCDFSEECTIFTVAEPCGTGNQIEFNFTACPPDDYKLRIEKEMLMSRGNTVCDTCPN